MTTSTLCGFLEDTGAQVRIFDMGRRVCEITRDDFVRFENTEMPYPLPMQQKAWFALAQMRPDISEPTIWFLRFDLDEQGKLILATRDYFIQRFLELANEGADKQDLATALEDNPFTFKPREDKMANLNALLGRELGRPPSQYFLHAREYFSGKLGWDQWNFIGYQGIADLAARQAEPQISRLLRDAIPQLPNEPLIALCQCIENQALADQLGEALLARLDQALQLSDIEPYLVAALIRGLSRANAQTRGQAVGLVLAHDCSEDPEILAAIGGRAWESLREPATLHAYIERLASQGVGQDIFNHCLADLMRLPGFRDGVLAELRSPARSQRVALAFQNMLG